MIMASHYHKKGRSGGSSLFF